MYGELSKELLDIMYFWIQNGVTIKMGEENKR